MFNAERNSNLRVSTIIVCCLAVLSGCRREPPDLIEPVPGNDSLRFSSQPIPNKPLFNLVDQPLQENEQATKVFARQLKILGQFANDVRNGGKTAMVPDLFSDQFETTFLERSMLQSAYLGERIRIARWRVTDKTPTSYEKIAVSQLFDELLAALA